MRHSLNTRHLLGLGIKKEGLRIGSSVVDVLIFAVWVVDGIEQMDSCPLFGVERAVFFQESETLFTRLLAPSCHDEVGMSSQRTTERGRVFLDRFGQGQNGLLSNRIADADSGRKELRKTLLAIVSAVERADWRIIFIDDNAERWLVAIICVLEVDNFVPYLQAIQSISNHPHSGPTRMILVRVVDDLSK